jgi:uncharacterized protein YcgI (DUF1989 family)
MTRLTDKTRVVPRPFDESYYAELRARLQQFEEKSSYTCHDYRGCALDVSGGELLRLTLLEGPQIVNLFAFNRLDPDERLWHQTIVSEGMFLSRFSRLWGTMPRLRPLLTILEDTVATRSLPGYIAHHHVVLGGSETPEDWRVRGGTSGGTTSWEQFVRLLSERGLPPDLLKEPVSLFQKAAIETSEQRLIVLPSDARAGDEIVLIAEIDLCVLIALSPYVDGTLSSSELGRPPRSVRVSVSHALADPLPWPYPGVLYPDISKYLDAHGVRSEEPLDVQVADPS